MSGDPDPDSLAAIFGEDADEVECEEMLYVADRAYKALTGEQLAGATLAYGDLGESWDFDDSEQMRARYPKLWAKFGWNPDAVADDDDDDDDA